MSNKEEQLSPPTFYSADEIFHEIPDDPDNVMMQIPPEIYERMGWKEGDNLKITVDDDGNMTIKRINE
jgi:AbrB family looped-hinge helix DNA binding protein